LLLVISLSGSFPCQDFQNQYGNSLKSELKNTGDSRSIRLEGVRTHNLKGIDVEFPIGKMTVVTGVSGSGKSSLVFDTLYSESYRRYVESLSSFARQYLKALPKPQVDTVRNLPAAIAVKQSRSGATSRSTVGTLTEINDLLRVLFVHLSRILCRNCGRVVEPESPSTIVRKCRDEFGAGQTVIVAAPLKRWENVKSKELRAQLEAQGFTRLVDPAAVSVIRIADFKETKSKGIVDMAVVIDRMEIKRDAADPRLYDAARLALRVGRGTASVFAGDVRLDFTDGLDCCGVSYAQPTLALLSFNHPLGACGTCQGFGFASEIDWEKVIPDADSSLAGKGIACWNFGMHDGVYDLALQGAKLAKLNVAKKPFSEYSRAEMEWLKTGKAPAELGGKNSSYHGIQGYFRWLDSKRYKPHYRIHAARYRKYVICPACNGARLKPGGLSCRIDGRNIADVQALPVDEFANWLGELRTSAGKQGFLDPGRRTRVERGMTGLVEAFDEAEARVGYLQRIGVGYLTFDRPSRTLSGGELQRINMARCLGSALTETLFCLDEPSVGLHARDSRRLLEIMREMRDQGNTVVVVEHERTVIDGADHLIEIGPKAGHEGGNVTHAGMPRGEVRREAKSDGSVVSKWLESGAKFIELTGARTNNLKNIDVMIPAGALTAVCGVSGSGKTSLIQNTFYPMVARALGQEVSVVGGERCVAKAVKPLPLIKSCSEVLLMSQAALGRSSRSNIATYLGIFDEIRKLMAGEPLAQKLGLTAGSFSFNTPGGRCETCRGLGTVSEDLSFLGDMDVTCPECRGRRFGDAVMSVTWRGKNLADILALTVSEARVFFHDRPAIASTLDHVIAMGLGYVNLGQHTSSFSGGEAQRLKLSELLREVRAGKPKILIFDEPTTGLSDSDVTRLMEQFRTLTKNGHTVIVVEHHIQVLKSADWLIEIGPEAAASGGELVYQGVPGGLAGVERSLTRPFLEGRA
jgi:excinuclease ABC subunit A